MYKILIILLFSFSIVFSEESDTDSIHKSLINRFGLEFRLSYPEVHNIGLRFEITEQIYLTGFYGGFWYLNKKTNEFENQILNYSLEVTYYAKDFLKLDDYGRCFVSFQFTDYKSNGSAFIDESEFNFYILRVGYEFDLGKSFKLNFKYGISYSDYSGKQKEVPSGYGDISDIPTGFNYRSLGLSFIYNF